MNLLMRNVLLAALGGFLLCAAAGAQEEDLAAEIRALKESQEVLRQELKAVRSELQELHQLLSALGPRAGGSATGAPGAAAAGRDPALAQIEQKLDRILADVAAIKKGSAGKQEKKVDTTVYDVDIGSSPVRGPRDAPVTIVEFADLQCPYCIREWPKLRQILDRYPQQVRLVFKHYPLSRHAEAGPAHAATILAQQQFGDEGFWEMHDLIVANPKKLGLADLREHAETLGLDLETFDEVMADPQQVTTLSARDKGEARKCNVRGTPTILINGLKLSDRSIAGYTGRIDELLKKGR